MLRLFARVPSPAPPPSAPRRFRRLVPALALAGATACGVIDALTAPPVREGDPDSPDAGEPRSNDADAGSLPFDPDAGLPDPGVPDAGFVDPGSTAATWSWRGPARVDLPQSPEADFPTLAVRPDGRLYAAWGEYDAAAETDTLWLAVRAPGAFTWVAKPVPNVPEEPLALNPQLAAGVSGPAVVVFHTQNATVYNPTSIRAARFDDGLAVALDDVVRLDANSHSPELNWAHSVAVDEAGHAIATWVDGGQQYVTVSAAGTSWMVARRFDTGTTENPLADVGASRGQALLAWPGAPGTFAAFASLADGTFAAAPHALSAEYTGRPHLVLRGDTGLVVWRAGGGLGFESFRGGWRGAGLVAGAERVGDLVDLAMNAAGRAVAIWQQDPPGSTGDMWAAEVYGATFDGLAWSAPQRLGLPGALHHAWDIDVDMNEHGDALAVWADYDETGTYTRIWANLWRATPRTWSGPVAIDDASPNAPNATQPEAGRYVTAALKPDGSGATVVWTEEAQIRVPHVWENRLE